MEFGVGGNSVPPNTNGAVGLTQYVQTVNEAYEVFDKETGASVLGPASISSLWSGFGGVCQNSGTGDPIVLYDDLANRWVISQLAGSGAPTDECVAISMSADATGAYRRYAFHFGSNSFDRPRIGVWPDGYYMSMSVFNSGGLFLGPQAFAFDRAAMLAGTAATFLTPGITGGASEPSFQPSDIDGAATPPVGTGNPFVSFPGTGTYTVRLFHADFVTPNNTTFNLVGSPAAAAFTMLCPATDACVPQPVGTVLLDGLGRDLMVRLVYRKFSDHESVVGNYAVSANGVAGIRWFELRNVTNGPVTVYQESTYQPDATWRWTGSAAMDRTGNLALGFSASSSTVNPSIRYTGRLASDPPNTLPQGEAILIAGGGSQTGSSGWGSQSSMTVDPVDDCTFWYTNEYYETTGSANWRTRIGNFKFKECTTGPTPPPTPTVTPTPTATPTPSATVPPPATPTPTDCPGFCGSPTPSPTVTPPATATPSPPPTPSPTATPSLTPAQALNISTRLRVETGDSVAIGGFIITGNPSATSSGPSGAPKTVALRGLGPSLSNSGLSDVLTDPTLELHGPDGALIMQNDNWQDDAFGGKQIANLGLAPQNPNESALVATLPPGAYSAMVAGKNQTSGLALVEIYDADTAADSQLANLSTRGFVRTGDNVMIGGFILGGGSAVVDVAVRGIGPSLGQAGLTDVLPDPTLELHDGNGALLAANDNWQDDAVSAAQLAGHGLAPANSLESGIFTTLPPGLFTAILAGKNGGIGLGLVEIYSGLDGNTLTVTSTADSGPGSLRDAIAAAGDGGTIQFDPALNGQTISLISGELVIDKSIAIRGPMIVQRSTADDTPAFRIFHVTPGHTVTMHGLTISNGFADMNNPSGGGVFNDQSTLTLSNCAVEYNHSAVGSGGGIYNSGSSAILTVAHSTVTNNVMEVDVFMCCGGGGFGAGIYSNGTLAIDHSTVSNNRIGYIQNVFSGDGGGIYSSGGAVTISNSSVSGNGANRVAGGIFNRGMLEITNSTINYNFSDRSGGGVYNEGTLAIDNSTFTGNSVGNLLAQGGGIKNLSGATMTIIRTTFSENSADGDGGGIFNSGATQIGNTILKANSTGGGNIFSEGGASTVTSLGYNLSSDNGGGLLTATGDQINTDPMLGPLRDNGGPTFTHELLTGSAAINAGDPTFTPPPLYDQRGPGHDRVVDGRIDIGSFEVQP